MNIPLDKHNILTWFPRLGFVNAIKVGAKNIASSSGWAIRRAILFRVNEGKLELIKAVYIHSVKIIQGIRAQVYQVILLNSIFRWFPGEVDLME